MTFKELRNQLYNEYKKNCDRLEHDFKAGSNDCKNGIYDKWYRYNRKDHGYYYDQGWMETNLSVKNDEIEFINEPSFP